MEFVFCNVESPWLLPVYSIETVHYRLAKLIIVQYKRGHVSPSNPSHFWTRPRLLKLQHRVLRYVSIILYTITQNHHQKCVVSYGLICLLTVAATKMTASGFLGTGKRVTSVRERTVLILSLTSSSVIVIFCAASSSLSASQAVPYFSIPSQKATTAECGDRKGSVATGVGWSDPTIDACTPPLTCTQHFRFQLS